eukprot:COSAG02_NODE_3314_length_6953_cov_4.605924_9_plen_206_part_00
MTALKMLTHEKDTVYSRSRALLSELCVSMSCRMTETEGSSGFAILMDATTVSSPPAYRRRGVRAGAPAPLIVSRAAFTSFALSWIVDGSGGFILVGREHWVFYSTWALPVMCTNRTGGRLPTLSAIGINSDKAHAAPRRMFERGAPGPRHARGMWQPLRAMCPRRRLGYLAETRWTRAQARVVVCSQRTQSSFKSPSSEFLTPAA